MLSPPLRKHMTYLVLGQTRWQLSHQLLLHASEAVLRLASLQVCLLQQLCQVRTNGLGLHLPLISTIITPGACPMVAGQILTLILRPAA